MGTVETLPGSGERCITNPTVYGYFDENGNPMTWMPFFGIMPSTNVQALPVPTTPIPPSDPSLPDDGNGVPGEISAFVTEGISRFDSVASLLAAAPHVLGLAQLSCESVVSVGNGFIAVGDDNTNATVKVYTNVAAHIGDRLIRLTGVVHTERGRLVLYAGSGPSPFFDNQGPGGGVSLASPDSVAGAKSSDSTSAAAAQSLARTLSVNPPQIDGGDVDVAGKIVTAVFPQSGSVSSFYIQEPITGGNGIKIVPQQPCSVVVGDIVRVTGTVVASSSTFAECEVDASTIDRTGYQLIPGPAGMSQRFMACGEFGLQQALFSNTTVTPAIQGAGLSPVGTRVRIWGRVTWKSQDGTVCFVDDGSALKSTYGGSVQTGLRVIWPQSCPSTYQQDEYAELTGVMGAELSEDDPALPVPVVRVPCSGQCNIIRVKWNSPGPVFDGKTWDTAYHSIQQGINSATSGDEVWVAAGTYAENIALPSGVRAYGSFAGTENVRQAERLWAANLTTIQGDGTDSVVYIGSGATSSTVLDGFTIQGGNWGHYINELYGNYGAGVCCNNAAPVISHNVISGNGDGSYASGGGISCYGGSPTVADNTISNNHAPYGGGIFCSQSSPTMVRNVISQNTETWYGGGIYLDSATSAVVQNNTITENGAGAGGGIYSYNTTGRFTSNAITYNSTDYYGGGGIYCSSYEFSGAPEIVNNTIAYNISPWDGGGLICDSCSSTIVNNIVSSNSNAQVVKYGSNDPIIHTNCIFGDTPYSGWYPNPTQDILTDPLLTGAHIQAGSPCRNTGDNSVVQAGDTDIDGQPRIQPINDPNAVVDIGADEWCEEDGGVITPITTTELDYFTSLVSYCN